jgi:hypothetical protein
MGVNRLLFHNQNPLQRARTFDVMQCVPSRCRPAVAPAIASWPPMTDDDEDVCVGCSHHHFSSSAMLKSLSFCFFLLAAGLGMPFCNSLFYVPVTF